MRKNILFFVAVVMIAFSLQNCSKDESSTNNTTPTTNCKLLTSKGWSTLPTTSTSFRLTYNSSNKIDSVYYGSSPAVFHYKSNGDIDYIRTVLTAFSLCSTSSFLFRTDTTTTLYASNKPDSLRMTNCCDNTLQHGHYKFNGSSSIEITGYESGYPVKYVLTLSNGNVTTEDFYQSGVRTQSRQYEYDDKINPYSNIQFVPGTGVPYAELFSKNNVTKIKSDCHLSGSYTTVNNITYTYNTNNLPVSASLQDTYTNTYLCAGISGYAGTVTFTYHCP